MRAGALLLVMGSVLAMATANAVGGTIIDMPAPKGHSVEKADLGAVALYRYASARTVPLYSYRSVPLWRPFYGHGFGFGFGHGFRFGLGYPFGFSYGRWYGNRRHSIGFRRSVIRHGLWR